MKILSTWLYFCFSFARVQLSTINDDSIGLFSLVAHIYHDKLGHHWFRYQIAVYSKSSHYQNKHNFMIWITIHIMASNLKDCLKQKFWFQKMILRSSSAALFNTLRPRQMDAISQTTFSNAFSSMKTFEFRLKFHWSLFPRVQLTIFHHWFR